MVEHRQLLYCRALAAHGHFGRAAESLGITQSSLTRSLQGLERSMGVKLFDRKRSRVEPTVFGQILLRHGERILLEGEDLVRELQLLQGLDTGRLTVTSALYPSEMSVHRAIGRMVGRHPKLRCRAQLRDWRGAIVDVLERQVDIAVAEISEAEDDSRLVTKTVGEHPLTFFCRPAHPLAGRKNLSLEEAFSYPWASTRGPARMTKYFPKSFGAAGWLDEVHGEFVSAIQVDTVATAKQVVAQSDALTPGPPVLFHQELASGELAHLEFNRPWFRLHYGFIYLQDRTLSPAAEAFIREVECVEAELACGSRSTESEGGSPDRGS